MKIIIALIVGVILAGFGFEYYKGMQRADKLAELESVEAVRARWADASRLAGSTSRIALSGPLKDMQQIRRELEAMTLTGCAGDVRELLVDGMTMEIEAYVAFMQNMKESVTAWAASEAAAEYRRASDLASACRSDLS